jgi:thymidine kinase
MPAESGSIEVICGPMFSGKTEELLRRLRRAQIARLPLQVFKPRIDNRYDAQRIVSHSAASMDAEVVGDVDEMTRAISTHTRVVGIDEVQFFGEPIVRLVERLADSGVRVLLAGLDLDYAGRPFEPMPHLLAASEYITKTLAICSRCGDPAARSQRLVGGHSRVVVGAADSYEARCRRCHVPRGEPKTEELFDPRTARERSGA